MKTIEEAAKNSFDRLSIAGADLDWNDFYHQFRIGAAFVQRWIPVEEEIPEADDFSVTLEIKIENGVVLTGYRFTDGDWMAYDEDGFGRQVKKKVTHWRPLNYEL